MGKNTLGTQRRYKEACTGLLKKRESSGNCEPKKLWWIYHKLIKL